jgi:hypothetical protein
VVDAERGERVGDGGEGVGITGFAGAFAQSVLVGTGLLSQWIADKSPARGIA